MENKARRRLRNNLWVALLCVCLSAGAVGSAMLSMHGEVVPYIDPKITGTLGHIFSAIFVLVFAWTVISVSYRYIRKGRIIVIAFLSIYAFGIWINENKHQYVNSAADSQVENTHIVTDVLAPINSALSAFFPSRGLYYENDNAHRDVWYHVYHLLSYFFVATFMFALLGRRFLNRSWHWSYRKKHKNIFWGYSANGRTLAESLQGKSLYDKALFVLNRVSEDRTIDELMDDDYVFNQINRIGAVALYDDYDRLKVNRRRYIGLKHFFMTDDQDFNVKMALQVLGGIRKSYIPKGEQVRLYVRTELENVDKFFREKLEECKLSEDVEVRLYNHSDLSARLFVKTHPIIKHTALKINHEECTVEGRMNVLILGLGWTGLELLKKTVCDAQFLGDNYKFSVTVIDRDFTEQHGRHKYAFLDAKEDTCGAIRINPEWKGKAVSKVNGEHFYDWLDGEDGIKSFDRIIVALGDDELNINTALQLTNFRMRYRKEGKDKVKEYEKIFSHVRDYEKYSFYKSKKSLIKVFGDLTQTNSCGVLIDEDMDKVGMLVNYVYSQYMTPFISREEFRAAVADWNEKITKGWLKEPEFNKDSSRAVAMNVGNLVEIAGGYDELKRKVHDSYHLEKYAEMEHLRWNAFHYVHGIRQWEVDEVDTQNGKLSIDGSLVKHICLMPYDELDIASDKVNEIKAAMSKTANEDFKETDRRIVRHFPYFIDFINEKK